jgi:hypothetical protein
VTSHGAWQTGHAPVFVTAAAGASAEAGVIAATAGASAEAAASAEAGVIAAPHWLQKSAHSDA